MVRQDTSIAGHRRFAVWASLRRLSTRAGPLAAGRTWPWVGRAVALAIALASSAPSAANADSEGRRRALEEVTQVFLEAERAERTARMQSTALTIRIETLKARRDLRDFSRDQELAQLLQQSLSVEQAISAARFEVDQARSQVEGAGLALAREIRRELDLERPRLRDPDLSVRQAAARKIAELRGLRSALAEVVERLRPSDPTRDSASLASPPIADPLDGPSELEEKADWVELSRQKVLRRLQELKLKADEAKADGALREAFLAFRRDSAHFDDSWAGGRPARVGPARRQESASGQPARDLATDPSSGGSRGPGGPQTEPVGSSAEGPATPSGAISGGSPSGAGAGGSTPEADPGTVGEGAGRGTGGGGATVAPATPFTPPHVTRDVTPETALGLELRQIGQVADPAYLEGLIQALLKLDTQLARQAQDLRLRARRLEREEDRGTDKP